VGKRQKNKPQLSIIGIYTETEKSELLRHGRYLEDADFSDVTVGPDLTRKQRIYRTR
jgi:hypothetical protein